MTAHPFNAWAAEHIPDARPNSRDHHNARAAWDVGATGEHATFEAWAALAFPWLAPAGSDYQNLKAAWGAGKAARG